MWGGALGQFALGQEWGVPPPPYANVVVALATGAADVAISTGTVNVGLAVGDAGVAMTVPSTQYNSDRWPQ